MLAYSWFNSKFNSILIIIVLEKLWDQRIWELQFYLNFDRHLEFQYIDIWFIMFHDSSNNSYVPTTVDNRM